MPGEAAPLLPAGVGGCGKWRTGGMRDKTPFLPVGGRLAARDQAGRRRALPSRQAGKDWPTGPRTAPGAARRCRGIPFGGEGCGELRSILLRKALPGHLGGGVRQLVGLVHHQNAKISEQGRQLFHPVDGVRQQVIVVADLDGKFAAARLFQVLAVSAALSRTIFRTHLRNAYLPPVEAAELRHGVQVKNPFERIQRLPLRRILLLVPDSGEPLPEPLIADKALLALADDSPDGLFHQPVFQKYLGQKGEIFLQNGGLQRDARGGNCDGFCTAGMFSPQDAGGEVGVGFADTHPCVAEGDFVLEQSVQHRMAEAKLFLPHRQPFTGEKLPEEAFRLAVRLFHGILVHDFVDTPVG